MAQIPSPSERGTRFEAEYDGSGNLVFFGTTAVGTLTSQAFWKIVKFTYDVSGNVIAAKYADGAKFTNVWDARAGLSYT